MKFCKWCNTNRAIEEFHKHKAMADGRLNKCKFCVLKTVGEWRKENPECRVIEHKRNREKLGKQNRQEWLKQLKETAIGRKVSINKYAAKRRTQTQFKDEFTEFVFEEAVKLRELRNKMTGIEWHIDHIVPLNGKLVCGLHVANNFRVIPASINRKKGNRFISHEVAGY